MNGSTLFTNGYLVSAGPGDQGWSEPNPTFAGSGDSSNYARYYHDTLVLAPGVATVASYPVEQPTAPGGGPTILARRTLHEDGVGAGNRRTWIG